MAGTREFHYRWAWELPASAVALWPLVSDTNRFNRDAGLPPVEDARAPDERLPNARRKLRLKVKGVLLEWEELPFEWFRPYRFGVVRRYSRGPLQEMRVLAELQEIDEGRTRLIYEVAARPRGLFGLVSTPLQIGIISRITFARTFRRYAEAADRHGVDVAPSPRVPAGSVRRIRAARGQLTEQGVQEGVAERLLDHMVASDDLTLARMRPYALADRWGEDRREVLRACLLGTRAGVLDLSWDILCPVCRGAKDGASTLRRLRTGVAHCDTCQIDFSPDFDQSVEVSFSPTPALREVVAPPFCVAGPQITPEVAIQQLLAPGETREVRAVLKEGRHRVRAFATPGGPSFLVEAGGREAVDFRVDETGAWSGHSEEPVDPEARIRLVNDTDEERLFDVERLTWGDTAATAAEVTALPDFRDLFDSEVLAAGDFVNVGNLAVLFTDLKGSTRMYQRVGDAPAFSRVMRHFDVLRAAVSAEDGAVVKTIGDAVMAVFRTPDAGVRAALAAHRALAGSEMSGTPLVLKAGLHFGPCIAVTLNDRLDYFGTTVNIAARLGGLSGGGDVVVSERVRGDPDVERLFMEIGASVRSSTTEIQGLDDRMTIWRVAAPREAPPPPQGSSA